jgi:hypothetical protein
MLSAILGFIPILGPLIQGVSSIFSSVYSEKAVAVKADADVTIAGWKSANDLTIAFQNNTAVNIARDIVMYPGALWCGLYIWGRTWDIYAPWLVIPVKTLDGPMAYLPFALLTFFFGMAAIKR